MWEDVAAGGLAGGGDLFIYLFIQQIIAFSLQQLVGVAQSSSLQVSVSQSQRTE